MKLSAPEDLTTPSAGQRRSPVVPTHTVLSQRACSTADAGNGGLAHKASISASASNGLPAAVANRRSNHLPSGCSARSLPVYAEKAIRIPAEEGQEAGGAQASRAAIRCGAFRPKTFPISVCLADRRRIRLNVDACERLRATVVCQQRRLRQATATGVHLGHGARGWNGRTEQAIALVLAPRNGPTLEPTSESEAAKRFAVTVQPVLRELEGCLSGRQSQGCRELCNCDGPGGVSSGPDSVNQSS